ncbi:PHP domain-containing protein, partial [Rickettsiales bacterium]|nr:PHP domain-containing protein [Rickettsiales bacterium]
MNKTFIHLRTKSSYSLGQSTLSVKQTVDLASTNLMPAIALADKNNLFGCLEFAICAKDKGIQPI